MQTCERCGQSYQTPPEGRPTDGLCLACLGADPEAQPWRLDRPPGVKCGRWAWCPEGYRFQTMDFDAALAADKTRTLLRLAKAMDSVRTGVCQWCGGPIRPTP